MVGSVLETGRPTGGSAPGLSDEDSAMLTQKSCVQQRNEAMIEFCDKRDVIKQA